MDASCLGQPGGTGDDWRLHLAYDFLAGRMSHVQVTDRRGGERLDRYTWQAGDVMVADNGYGYRRSVAWAVQQQADVVVRMYPPPSRSKRTRASRLMYYGGYASRAAPSASGAGGVGGNSSAIACG